jgi:hypothetical protein
MKDRVKVNRWMSANKKVDCSIDPQFEKHGDGSSGSLIVSLGVKKISYASVLSFPLSSG